MINIYVDADGCPVKNEVFRVAQRYGLKVYVVADTGMRIPEHELFELIIVNDRFDAADDWIVEHLKENDIAVSADIPLAARCIAKGARTLDPRGRVFNNESVSHALAARDFMAHLRDMGNVTAGPPPFEKRDRSRFLRNLDEVILAALKTEGQAVRNNR
ncbi:MAG: YaiI/YqxD family protein [Desulfomonile sp.]|nr:YaiI/YqxD family protein [Desulfomonile sp.]